MAKKQNIIIDSRSGNKRIELAIPQFMKRFGMKKDQATAVAIRLESIGRLQVSGKPIQKDTPRGIPTTVPPLAVLAAVKAMKKKRQPTRTVYRGGDEFVVSSAFEAREIISKPKKKAALKKKRSTRKRKTNSRRVK